MAKVHEISRRSILLAGAAVTLSSVAASARAAVPQGGKKLIVVILRGAMDGLFAMPKLDDPDIMAHRGELVDEGAIALGGGFALHPELAGLADLYKQRQAAFAPAAAGPYRQRSHFEAQDLLESGSVATVSRDGWLNRALQKAPAAYSAVSIGPVQPLILRGAAAATSWSPAVLPAASDDTLNRLMDLYAGDPILEASLKAGLGADQVAGRMGARPAAAASNPSMQDGVAPEMTDAQSQGVGGGRGGTGQYAQLLLAAGKFLAAPGGPDIAVVSLEGWDTHANQKGALEQRFKSLDAGIAGLKQALGPAWDKATLIAMSEFGRTVRMNGAKGTDHGTAGLMILAGGAVKGGRLVGDWPGLRPAALFENRDLAPALDVRAAFKGLLRDHLGWSKGDLDGFVFPDSAVAPPLAGLV